MSEAGGGHRDIPRFVVGSEDDEQDLGPKQADMKNEVFQESEVEDEEDEEVSSRPHGEHGYRGFRFSTLKSLPTSGQ